MRTFKVFDSHFHIIDRRFPLVPGPYTPDPFSCEDYLERTKGLGLAGGAVVSASFQGFDQSFLLDALRKLGPGFVGVTQLPASVRDEEVMRLDKAGVRGVRFNLRRGGSEKVENLEALAGRVHGLAGWHVELYVDSRDLQDLAGALLRLPAVSIDHLGLSRDGFDVLLLLAEKGVRVKASGFGRGDLEVKEALRRISRVNPDSLMFGTDLPSTRSPRPFSDEDFTMVAETLDEKTAQKVFFDNAVAFYRPRLQGRT